MKERHNRRKEKEAMVIAVVDALGNLGVSDEPPEPEPTLEPENAAVESSPFLDVCCGTKSPNDAIAAVAADEPEPEPEPEPGPEMDSGSRCPGQPQGSAKADRQKLGAGLNNCPLSPGPRADRGVFVDVPILCPNVPGDVEDQGYGGGGSGAGGAVRRGRSRQPPRLRLRERLQTIREIWRSGVSLMPGGRAIRILDLCCGTKALKEACEYFKSKGYEVEYVGVDSNGFCTPDGPEVEGDILRWRELPQLVSLPVGYFDFIWGSPPCRYFSRGNTRATKAQIKSAEKIVQAVKDCILHFAPPSWILENPAGRLGHLPSMTTSSRSRCPLMRTARRYTVSYCMYGTLYRKRTHLWSNIQDLGNLLLNCTARTPCPLLLGGLETHARVCQHGVSMSTGTSGVPDVNERYRPPQGLLAVVCKKAVEQARAMRWRRGGLFQGSYPSPGQRGVVG